LVCMASGREAVGRMPSAVRLAARRTNGYVIPIKVAGMISTSAVSPMRVRVVRIGEPSNAGANRTNASSATPRNAGVSKALTAIRASTSANVRRGRARRSDHRPAR